MDTQSIEVVMVKRIRGMWDTKNEAHVLLSIEEVGKMILQKHNKKPGQLFKETKVGEWVMLHFYGTLTQIAECYKAAGEEIYKEYCKVK